MSYYVIIGLVCLFIPFGIFSLVSLCYVSSKADKEIEKIYKNELNKGSYDRFSDRPLEQV